MSNTQPTKLTIQIDKSKMTFGDLRFIMRMNKENSTPDSIEKLFALLDRIVVGGIDDVPLDAMDAIRDAMAKAFAEDADVKN